MTPDKKYTIAEIVKIYDLTPEQVAEMAGISVTSVKRNIEGSQHRTKEIIAEHLAEALGMHVDEIIWINGRTEQGRTPGKWSEETKVHAAHTFRVTHTVAISTKIDRLCPECNAILPVASDICDVCG